MLCKKIKDKKGFLGTGIAGIVSLFFVFFILLIFVIASAAIAGKIHLPVVGKTNNVEIEEGFEKSGSFEIKQRIVSVLESPLEYNGKRVKDTLRDKGLSELSEDALFQNSLVDIIDSYVDEDFCFFMYYANGDEKFKPNKIEIGVDKGKTIGGCTSLNKDYVKGSVDFLTNKGEIKTGLYIENE